MSDAERKEHDSHFPFQFENQPAVAAMPPEMRSENPSWILVEGSNPETIRQAVIEYSGLLKHVKPSRHCVAIMQLSAGRYGVTFDPPAPPYAFTNLIGWLGYPKMTRGVRLAVGWLVAPGSGVRYFLAQRGNAGGDTLVGVGADGVRVSVFRPSCEVSRSTEVVRDIPEPELAGAEPVASFEITVDGDASFGNPQFVVT
jgi:hypothetical protein